MITFYSEPEYRKARKQHQCMYCAESIGVGDDYVYQSSVYDNHWYTLKMHTECFDELCDDGECEYTPYSNERPKQSYHERDSVG